MAQPTWKERSKNLQQSFSTSALPSLPMMVPRPALKQKYHKLQRFGVSHAGRTEKSEVVKANVKNFSLDEKLRLVPGTQDLYKKKHELVREWELLEEEEKRRTANREDDALESRLKKKKQQYQRGNNNLEDFMANNQEDEGDQGLPAVDSPTMKVSASESSLRIPPRWVQYDREVLRFYLYFKEAVHESRVENYRVRKCVLLYYMTDCSIQIEEPKEENSGLPQGVFLKRTPLYKEDGTRYGPLDFQIGDERLIFGRCFRVVNMDAKTRGYFRDVEGIEVLPGEPYPLDTFAQKKIEAGKERPAVESIAGAKPKNTLGQYLKNDNKVLRFRCVWDDTDRLYGKRNEYTLQYYLSDDSVEVRNNAKGEAFPLLLKRQKLVKNMDQPDLGYVTPLDLLCGEFVNCYKRPLLILSCDSFTEKFYARVHGIQQRKVRIKQAQQKVVETELPPYNGFGSEADSLANCINLIPKPVKQDLHRFLNNRGKELRFRAKLVSPEPEETGRRYVITYFMDDDTLAVYEPPQRNSGIVGGKFLQRDKYKKPASPKHPDPDPSEIQSLLYEKIQSKMVGGPYGLLKAFKKFRSNEAGDIDFTNFKEGLRRFLPYTITDEQIYSLFQKYDKSGDGHINYQEFVDNVMKDKDCPTNSSSSFTTRWYRPSDLYVGAKVRLVFPRTGACTQEFEIIGADSQTLRLMESNPSEFPKSNVQAIASTLSRTLAQHGVKLRDTFRGLDKENQGWISTEVFIGLLKSWAKDLGLVDDELTDQEALTLVRHYDSDGDNKIRYSEFCDAVMSQVYNPVDESKVDDATALLMSRLGGLKGNNVRKLFRELDSDSSGQVTWNEFQQLLWNNEIELSDDELALLVLKFDTNGDGSVAYDEFCDVLYGQEMSSALMVDEKGNKLAVDSSNNRGAGATSSLSQNQQRLKTPTMQQYKAILLKVQKEEDGNVELKALMKAFSSGYFNKKLSLRKNFLAFDLDNTGLVGRPEFEEALVKTNPDFSRKHKDRLVKYFFPSDGEVEYDEFMNIMFKNDVLSATRKYGPLNV